MPANDITDLYPQMGAVKAMVIEAGTLLVQAIPAPAWGLGVGEGSMALCPEGDTQAWGLLVVFVEGGTL